MWVNPIIGWKWGVLPILAGKIGSLTSDAELRDFKEYDAPDLTKVLCHPLRIAIICDAGEQGVFTVPAGDNV